MDNITTSKEDYLKALLILSQYEKTILSKDVAEFLGITKASVSRMMGILKNEGYIIKEKYGTIRLSETGINTANEIKNRYDFVKKFLINILGIDSDKAEKEACRLEHVISNETISLISQKIHV